MLSEEYDALDERVSEIERSLSTAMEALTDLMSTPADEEAPEPGPSANGMLVRGFDPQAIAHPARAGRPGNASTRSSNNSTPHGAHCAP